MYRNIFLMGILITFHACAEIIPLKYLALMAFGKWANIQKEERNALIARLPEEKLRRMAQCIACHYPNLDYALLLCDDFSIKNPEWKAFRSILVQNGAQETTINITRFFSSLPAFGILETLIGATACRPPSEDTYAFNLNCKAQTNGLATVLYELVALKETEYPFDGTECIEHRFSIPYELFLALGTDFSEIIELAKKLPNLDDSLNPVINTLKQYKLHAHKKQSF